MNGLVKVIRQRGIKSVYSICMCGDADTQSTRTAYLYRMIYMEIVCEREMRYRIGISTASSTCVALAQTSWSHRRCVTIRFSVQLADRYIAIGFVQPKACKFTKSNMYHGDGGQISWFAFWGGWLVLDVDLKSGSLRLKWSVRNNSCSHLMIGNRPGKMLSSFPV